MRKVIFLILAPVFIQAQSILLEPSLSTSLHVLKLQKDGIGLDHRNPNFQVGVGTYATGSTGYIQTHTNHPLAFATNNGVGQVYLLTNGNFGIGTQSPAYILDVNGRVRIRHLGNTSGIWFSKSNNAVNEGAFFGNINDSQTGIWIGNQWRMSVSESGVFNLPSLAGSGIRNVAADASGNLLISDNAKTSFGAGITNNMLVGTNEAGIEFEFEEYDLLNNVNRVISAPDYFTVSSTGPYQCTYNVIWEGNANGSRTISIRDQTGLPVRLITEFPGHGNIFYQHGTLHLSLETGKQYNLFVSQSTASLLTIYPHGLGQLIWSCTKL